MATGRLLALIQKVLCGLLFCTVASSAAPLPQASGDVVLTISGAIENTNAGETVALDMAALEALPHETITTTTPWTNGKTEFEGVKLSDLMSWVGAHGVTLSAIALNDYQVSLPIMDENGLDPIVAYKVDGKHISVREKGPLWVIYPFDQQSVAQSETYYSRSIWQLVKIVVEP